VRRSRGDRAAVEHSSARDEIVAPDQPTPAPDAVEKLIKDTELTPACRAVFLLHFQEEMTLQEVAAVLELT